MSEAFTVTYNGEPMEFSPIRNGEGGPLVGYGYRHPPRPGFNCAYNWIDTESGKMHRLTFDAEGRATIVASLLCPQGCGWHVMITDGVARDC